MGCVSGIGHTNMEEPFHKTTFFIVQFFIVLFYSRSTIAIVKVGCNHSNFVDNFVVFQTKKSQLYKYCGIYSSNCEMSPWGSAEEDQVAEKLIDLHTE